VSLSLLAYLSYAHNSEQCTNSNSAPATNSGTNNYVIDLLSGFMGVTIPFPYAIGQCTSHSLESTNTLYYIHTCTADGKVSTKEYQDSSCTTSTGNSMVSNTIDMYQAGHLGYFQCSGQNTYSLMYLVAASGASKSVCSTLQPIYAGLGPCVDAFGHFGLLFSTYCDSTQTLMEWFVGSQMETTMNPSSTEMYSSSTTELGMGESSTTDMVSSSTMNPDHTPITCDAAHYCYDLSVPMQGECAILINSEDGEMGLFGYTAKCTATSSSGGGGGNTDTKAAVRSSVFALWFAMAGLLALIL